MWDGDTRVELRRTTYDVEQTVSLVVERDYPATDPEKYVAMLRCAQHWREI
jgi:hypothetical protein